MVTADDREEVRREARELAREVLWSEWYPLFLTDQGVLSNESVTTRDEVTKP